MDIKQFRSSKYATLYVCTVLFILTLGSRITFRSQYLYHWDSVQYALATEHFDVSLDQPQRPGYILYIGLGWLLDLVTGDPQTSFVWTSVVFSALAVASLYDLGRRMFDHRTGLVAALMLGSSPLFWFFGEIAMPHAVETFFVIALAILLYRIMSGEPGLLLFTALLLGLATGVRQTTVVFLFPLCIFAARKVGLLRIALAGLVFGAICLAWFIPMVSLSGGLTQYFDVFMAHNRSGLAPTSLFTAGLPGMLGNLTKLVRYTAYAWALAAIPGIVYILSLRRGWRAKLGDRRVAFLAVWLVPALAFYAVIHMGNQGLVFVFFPALVLIGAAGFVKLTASWDKRWALMGLATIIVIDAGLFLLAPEYLLSGDRVKILSRQTIRDFDRRYEAKIRLIQERFDPEQTLVLATAFRHASYYLPDYRVVWMPALDQAHEVSSPTIYTSLSHNYQPVDHWSRDLAPSELSYLLLFDENLIEAVDVPVVADSVESVEGDPLYYFQLSGDQIASVRCCLPTFLGLVDRSGQ